MSASAEDLKGRDESTQERSLELFSVLRTADKEVMAAVFAHPLLAPMLAYCRQKGQKWGVADEWADDFLVAIWEWARLSDEGPPTDDSGQVIRSVPAYLWRVAMNIVAGRIGQQLRSRETPLKDTPDEEQRLALERPEREEVLSMVLECASQSDPAGEKHLLRIFEAISEGKTMVDVARETRTNYNTLKSHFRRFCLEVRKASAAVPVKSEVRRDEGVHGG